MMTSFMTWIHRCNDGLEALATGEYLPFVVQGNEVGYVDRTFVHAHLEQFEDIFDIGGGALCLTEQLENCGLQERSQKFGEAMKVLKEQGIIDGWRDEVYPVLTCFHSVPVLLMERAASVFFGIKAYGTYGMININAVVVVGGGVHAFVVVVHVVSTHVIFSFSILSLVLWAQCGGLCEHYIQVCT